MAILPSYPIADIVLAGGLRQNARFGADPERARLYRELAELSSLLGTADRDLARRIIFSPGYVPRLDLVRDAVMRGRAAAAQAPACCQHCGDKTDCGNIDVCRAVDDAWKGRPGA